MSPHSLLAAALAMALAMPLPGQQPSGPGSNLLAQPQSLKIVVLQGEGAVNSVRAKVATNPMVEVRDQNDKPVAGAEVVFRLPRTGPGGTFNGWMLTQTGRSNPRGQVAATGLTPNDQEGRFQIVVTANLGGKTATAVINQENGRAGAGVKSGRSGMWKVLAILGGAAAAGTAIALTRNGKSTAATPVPVTATPGAITVGAPR